MTDGLHPHHPKPGPYIGFNDKESILVIFIVRT